MIIDLQIQQLLRNDNIIRYLSYFAGFIGYIIILLNNYIHNLYITDFSLLICSYPLQDTFNVETFSKFNSGTKLVTQNNLIYFWDDADKRTVSKIIIKGKVLTNIKNIYISTISSPKTIIENSNQIPFSWLKFKWRKLQFFHNQNKDNIIISAPKKTSLISRYTSVFNYKGDFLFFIFPFLYYIIFIFFIELIIRVKIFIFNI